GLPNLNKAALPPSSAAPALGPAGMLRYAAPEVASTMLMTPLFTVVPGIYAKFFNLELTTLAGLLLLVRVLDSLGDIALGMWSDRWVARGGTRKPFIVIGAAVVASCSFLLGIPAPGYEKLWFSLSAMLVLIGWSAFEIPHLAWGADLTPEPVWRGKLFGYRAM